jgi:hypothetical protein
MLRMPNTAFGISMGLAGNALMLWKLARDADFDFVADWMDASMANTVMWFAACMYNWVCLFVQNVKWSSWTSSIPLKFTFSMGRI